MPGPRSAVITQLVTVSLLAVGVVWFSLGSRAVLDVGGACATGGPYVGRTACPDGTGLVLAGFPLALVTAMVGGIVVRGTGAPSPLLLAWVGVFGLGGWSFLDAGLLRGGPDTGWIVTGVVFWLMALPVAAYLVAPRRLQLQVASPSGVGPDEGRTTWWLLTAAALLVGAGCGALGYGALV